MTFTNECLEQYFKSLPPRSEAFARAQRKHLVSEGQAPNPVDYGVDASRLSQSSLG